MGGHVTLCMSIMGGHVILCMSIMGGHVVLLVVSDLVSKVFTQPLATQHYYLTSSVSLSLSLSLTPSLPPSPSPSPSPTPTPSLLPNHHTVPPQLIANPMTMAGLPYSLPSPSRALFRGELTISRVVDLFYCDVIGGSTDVYTI